MTAFWLTYKPLSSSSPRGWPPEELRALLKRFETDPANTTPLWRIASHQQARVGDRFFLFKQGSGGRGVFGTGELIEPPSEQADPTDIDNGPKYRVRIRFDRLVDPDRVFLIGFDIIETIVPASLIDAQASGTSVPAQVETELETRLPPTVALKPPIGSKLADDATFDPDSVGDDRERAFRAIRLRRGQPTFRAELLEAYGQRCAISGCPVVDVLDAAHITPYGGKLTNHVSNGLLLRTDIHTLFDCGLLAIEPTTRKIVIADALKDSSYNNFSGRPLRRPQNDVDSPSKKNLQKRYEQFAAKQGYSEAQTSGHTG